MIITENRQSRNRKFDTVVTQNTNPFYSLSTTFTSLLTASIKGISCSGSGTWSDESIRKQATISAGMVLTSSKFVTGLLPAESKSTLRRSCMDSFPCHLVPQRRLVGNTLLNRSRWSKRNRNSRRVRILEWRKWRWNWCNVGRLIHRWQGPIGFGRDCGQDSWWTC